MAGSILTDGRQYLGLTVRDSLTGFVGKVVTYSLAAQSVEQLEVVDYDAEKKHFSSCWVPADRVELIGDHALSSLE